MYMIKSAYEDSLWELLFVKMFLYTAYSDNWGEIIVGLCEHLLHYVEGVVKHLSAVERPLVPVVSGVSTGDPESAYCKDTPLIKVK